MDREKVIEEMPLLRDFLIREQRKVFKGNNDSAVNVLMHYRNIVIDAIAMLKEQKEQIEQLEYDLAVTQNNLNYYLNGND